MPESITFLIIAEQQPSGQDGFHPPCSKEDPRGKEESKAGAGDSRDVGAERLCQHLRSLLGEGNLVQDCFTC